MNPIIVGLVLGFFFLADILATHLTQRYYRHRYPKNDYREFEMNPIVKWGWTKFGFDIGSLLMPVLLFPFLLMLIYGSLYSWAGFYFICGAYVVVLSIHLHNIVAIAEKRKTDFTKMYDKLYGGAEK